jgi:peptidoglycan L-alanyl-D-glutamate endopeptidase CwlK
VTQAQHLARIDHRIRPKIAAILKDLEGHGWQPRIASSYRSLAEQQALKDAGRSTVSFSFHNHTYKGLPAALAADIIDRRYGWSIPQGHQFWRHLGSSARAHGLTWGGDWKRFPDVAHVEIKGLTLAQAKRETV